MTTTTQQQRNGAGLLQAILDEPDADDLRLIYADWLQENGEEERAEFIRAAIAAPDAHLATNLGWLTEKSLVRLQLAWRAWQHATKVQTRFEMMRLPLGFNVWLGGTGIPPEVILRRGFVHTIRCSTKVWRQHRVKLVRNHPVQRVELTDKEPVRCLLIDGEDIAGKFRWSKFVGGEEGETNHYVGDDLIPRVAEASEGFWSIHDTPEAAKAWLSAGLILRAKELAREAEKEEARRQREGEE